MNQSSLQHQLYTTSRETWDAMLESIKNAKKNIILEQFYFQPDDIGKKFAGALIERVRAGVSVRCLFDAAGSVDFGSSKLLAEMKTAGVNIKFFNWLRPFSKGFYKFGYFRNHRRLLLIDFDTNHTDALHTVALHGGICIGNEAKKWNDLVVKISVNLTNSTNSTTTTNPATLSPFREMSRAFEKMWDQAENGGAQNSGSNTRSTNWKKIWTDIKSDQIGATMKQTFGEFMTKRRALKQEQIALKNMLFSDEPNQPFFYTTQSPFPGKHVLYRLFIKKISKATKNITITTPYFLPDHRIMRKLAAAKRRGVEIDIIIPQKTDHPFVDIGCRTYMDYFLTHNIKVHKHPQMIHGKGAVIDGAWAMVSSMNMDNISLRYNFESGVTAGNPEFVSAVETALHQLKSDSKILTTADWNKRSISEKIAEVIVWPFRKLL